MTKPNLRDHVGIAVLLITSATLLVSCSRQENMHKEVVKSQLTDPESAQFKNARQSKQDTEVWCGEINSKNRLGGYTGFQRYVIQTIGFGEVPPEEVYISRLVTEDGQPEEFKSAWRLFCE